MQRKKILSFVPFSSYVRNETAEQTNNTEKKYLT